MPSCTGVVQAGSRRLTPETSTMHRRQAPTGVMLSSQHSVGMYLPLARATSRMVWPCVRGDVFAVDSNGDFLRQAILL